MVRGVPIDNETSKMTLLILKICRLSLLNMLIRVGCVHVFMSVRACVRVCIYICTVFWNKKSPYKIQLLIRFKFKFQNKKLRIRVNLMICAIHISMRILSEDTKEIDAWGVTI